MNNKHFGGELNGLWPGQRLLGSAMSCQFPEKVDNARFFAAWKQKLGAESESVAKVSWVGGKKLLAKRSDGEKSEGLLTTECQVNQSQFFPVADSSHFKWILMSL